MRNLALALVLLTGCKVVKDKTYVPGEAPIEKVGPLSGRCETLGVTKWYWYGPEGGLRYCQWDGGLWRCSGPGAYNPNCDRVRDLTAEDAR